MKQPPETRALQHALAMTRTHREALADALDDLLLRDLKAMELDRLNRHGAWSRARAAR
jgi:hypothetical protein